MITLRRVAISFCVLAVSLAAGDARADTWPAWRGLAGRGVSSESDLPVEWSQEKNLAWKIDLPGRGNSSPAVTATHIFLTTKSADHSLRVLAIDRKKGSILWDRKVGSGELKAAGPKSNYAHRHNAATASPVADGEHVWAMFGTGLLVCLDSGANIVWKRDLVEKYGEYQIGFGMASSPRLWGDLLYIMRVHKGPSFVLALDKKTGETVWRKERQLPAKDNGPDGYSSPVVLQSSTGDALIVAGADHVNAYDLRTGMELWISSGLTIDSENGRIIASPALSDGVVVACSGNPHGAPGHAIALRAGGSGDITKSHRMWTYTPYTPDSPTPVCYQGRVYMVRDDGVGSVLDLNTGDVVWRERVSEGTFRSSTIAGDGKVYFLNNDGLCTVVAAGPKHKVLAQNKLEGRFFATPAVSDGVIYLRAHRRLYAVASK